MMKNIDNIPEGNPFKVPENYFKEVTKKLIESAVEKQSEIKKPGLYIKLRFYLALAASVAVLAILSYTGLKLVSHENKSSPLTGISPEEYSEIIFNDIDLITLEENAELSEMPQEDYYVDKKDIIDYLILENIDINEINDQL